MRDFHDTAARYIQSFNETDAGRRRELLGRLYTEDARYTDPAHDVTGPGAIDEFISSTQERFPGYVFSLRGPRRASPSRLMSALTCWSPTTGRCATCTASSTKCRARDRMREEAVAKRKAPRG
jgi:hypothetical protein